MIDRTLSARPVGSRKGWRCASTDTAAIGAQLRAAAPWVAEIAEWGEPVEAQEWRDRRGTVKRLIAVYANGRHADLSRRADGTRHIRIKGA